MSDILRKRATMASSSNGTRDINRYGVSKPQSATGATSPREQQQSQIDATLATSRSEADSKNSSTSTRASVDTFHTARTFEVATEKGGRKLMSEEEVSSLVHNALRRARQATSSSSISPRHRTRPNPLSPRTTASVSSTVTSPRPPTSPSKLSLLLPELSSQSSFPKPRYAGRTSYGRGDESLGGVGGESVVFKASSIDHNVSNISADASDFNPSISESPTEDSLSDHRRLTSVNSSEAIIRRVEEEIANARRAAQEANRRLAGVSANLRLNNLPESFTRMSPVDDVLKPDPPSKEMEVPSGPSGGGPSVENVLRPQASDGSSGPSMNRHEIDNLQSQYDSETYTMANEFEDGSREESYQTRSRTIVPSDDEDDDPSLDVRNQDSVGTTETENASKVQALLDEVLANSSAENPNEEGSNANSLNGVPSTSSDWGHMNAVKVEQSISAELLQLESESIDKERYYVATDLEPMKESNEHLVEMGPVKTHERPKPTNPESRSEFHSQFSARGNIIMRILAETDKEPVLSPHANEEATYQKPIHVDDSCHEVIDLTAIESDGSQGLGSYSAPKEKELDTAGSSAGDSASAASSKDAPLEYDAPDILGKSASSVTDRKITVGINEQGIAISMDMGSGEGEDFELSPSAQASKYLSPSAQASKYRSYEIEDEDASSPSDVASEADNAPNENEQMDIVPIVVPEIENAEFAEIEAAPSDSLEIDAGASHSESLSSPTGNNKDVEASDSDLFENTTTSDVEETKDVIVAPAPSNDTIRINDCKVEETDSDAATEVVANNSGTKDDEELEASHPEENDDGKEVVEVDNTTANTEDNNGDKLDSDPSAESPPKTSNRFWWTSKDETEAETQAETTLNERGAKKAKEDQVDKQKSEPVVIKDRDAPAAVQDKVISRETTRQSGPRSNKVRFKQRYPVPPLIEKPRPAEEIARDHRIPQRASVPFLSKPKPDLQHLLEAAVCSSLARRSNACGALKVLSTQKKNQLTLVRTAGFLDALVFASTAKISNEDRESAMSARTRAVSTICNISEPKDNREIVFCHPGMVMALVQTAMELKYEARAHACGALAMLAKTPSNREPMAQTQNLINVLATILCGGTFEKEKLPNEPKSSYSADDEESARQSYSSESESTRSSLGNDSSVSHDEEEVTVPTVRSMREQQNERTEETVARGKMSACAALLHISKQCGATPFMCYNKKLMDAVVEVSQKKDDPMHTKCLEIICNLSRFRANVEPLAKYPGLIDSLVVNGGSMRNQLDRMWSLRVLQNLSTDVAGKTVLANRVVLELLSFSVMRETLEEQLAATATLYNLSTEPGAVVPLTNTKNVVATLVHVAHNPQSASEVRIMACDALATLGLWLQTLAGAGVVPKEIDENLTLPSYVTTGWKRWD